MPKTYERIFAQLFNTPWLITEDWMKTIIEIARREGDIEAVRSKMSQPLDETRTAFVRDGVAHIPIAGPIFPKANLMTEFSGATSIAALARDFDVALDDDDIHRIVLDIDSPGGAVTGVNEMANIIKQANAHKEVISYVSGTGASAAYWLASAANEVVLDATARVGSIGVVVAYPSSKNEDRIEIVNTASPNKRIDPSTDKGKEVVTEELDALADVFIATVAENMGVSEKVVRSDFGRGGILVGKNAVEVGMADRLGSFETLLTETSNYGGSVMTQKSTKTTVVTAESLKKDHPEAYEDVFKAGAATTLSENDKSMKDKDDQIANLKADLEKEKGANEKLNGRVDSLEKNEMIRSAKEIGTSATAIMDAKLSASDIPSSMHVKVAKMVDHKSFMKEGIFDATAYSAAIDAEVADWESKLGDNDSVLGFSTSVKETSEEENAETDSIVDRMIGHVNIVQ